jgi:hypothetical protein
VSNLILRSAHLARVPKDGCGLSWFETAQVRLLTMRISSDQFGQIYPVPAGDLKHPTDSGMMCFGNHNTTFGK